MKQDMTEAEAEQQWKVTHLVSLRGINHTAPHYQPSVGMGSASRRTRARRRQIGIVFLVLATLGFALTWTSQAQAAQASCFGPGLWGNQMADGTILGRRTIAVAHRTLPLGTRLNVRYRNRTRLVVVRDRGPFVAGRMLDLTMALVQWYGVPSCRAWGERTVTSWRA